MEAYFFVEYGKGKWVKCFEIVGTVPSFTVNIQFVYNYSFFHNGNNNNKAT